MAKPLGTPPGFCLPFLARIGLANSDGRRILEPMKRLLDTLAAELERARPLAPQAINHLGGSYGVGRDVLGAFLESELPKLEDYEVDLILSPLFTPQLRDQAVFAELLGADAVSPATWPGLIAELAARPTRARLVTEDGQTHSVVLREVVLERYVNRLRLGASVPAVLFNLLSHLPPPADRPMLKAVARRAIWENDSRRQVLLHYLTNSINREEYSLADTVELLRLMETYEPRDADDLLGRIPHWQQVLRHQIALDASPKPFFNERVQELHGGGRDQRRQDNARIDAREREAAFLERLKSILGQPVSRAR